MYIWVLSSHTANEGISYFETYAPGAYEAARADFLAEAAHLANPIGPIIEKPDGGMEARGKIDLLILEKVVPNTTPVYAGEER